MVFSPYTARKLAETTARKVKEKITSDEVTRQIPNQSNSHRAPRDVPHSKSKVKVGRLSDESHRLRDENKTTNWRTGEADKLLDEHYWNRNFGANPSEGRRVTDKIKSRAEKKKKKAAGDKWRTQDIFAMPLSKVSSKSRVNKNPANKTDRKEINVALESTFESTQWNAQYKQDIPMGATKSDKSRLSRKNIEGSGEQSYDPKMVQKWRGIGLGLGGAGALGGGGFAYNGIKEKKTMGRPDYSNYFG